MLKIETCLWLLVHLSRGRAVPIRPQGQRVLKNARRFLEEVYISKKNTISMNNDLQLVT